MQGDFPGNIKIDVLAAVVSRVAPCVGWLVGWFIHRLYTMVPGPSFVEAVHGRGSAKMLVRCFKAALIPILHHFFYIFCTNSRT